MTITSLSGISGVQQSQSIQKASDKVQRAIASLVGGRKDDVTSLSIATRLQSETSGLKQVSSNLAQALSLTQVADGGATQIQSILGQLQKLASESSSPALNAENRKQLDKQFHELTDQLDALVKGTTFNGKSLLDGSLDGDNALSLDNLLSQDSSGNDVSVGNLSSSGLFSNKSLNLLSSEGAQAAFATVGNALNAVTSVRAAFGSFEQTVNFAAANVDSAIANQEAARAELQDTDFAEASTASSLAGIQRNATIALAAQGNNLSPALLQLIG